MQSISQSVSQSVTQSLSQSISQSVNHSVNQSISQSVKQPINQPTKPTSQSFIVIAIFTQCWNICSRADDVAQFLEVRCCEVGVVTITPLDVLVNAVDVNSYSLYELRLQTNIRYHAIQFIHSFITSIYIAPLQVGLLRGTPNPNTTK